MNCPTCQTTLECQFSITTEKDDRPIELTYQWWLCPACSKKYHALCEDSKVNVFDDTVLHTGYHTDEITWQKTLTWAKQCPQPHNKNCQCIVHREIGTSLFSGTVAWFTS